MDLPYGVWTRITGNGPSAGVVVPGTAGAWIAPRRTRPSLIVIGMSLVTTTSYSSGPGDHAAAATGGAGTTSATRVARRDAQARSRRMPAPTITAGNSYRASRG